MPNSQQFSIIDFAISSFVVTGVAVMMSQAVGPEHHSIPLEAKKPLIEKYGKWAVNRAEALCPHNDVACVEREAKRSLEVYRQRRELW
jgi:hypothetical protein